MTPVLLSERKAWDSQADTFALDGHRSGKTVWDTSRELIRIGYKASTHDVAMNLKRLGVVTVNWGKVITLNPWDAQADKITMTAHLAGKTVTQIMNQLSSTGYSATKAEVGISLSKQGVTNVQFGAGVPSPLSWDARADALAMAGHRAGKAASEIAGQLRSNGYAVTPVQVMESLHRQWFL